MNKPIFPPSNPLENNYGIKGVKTVIRKQIRTQQKRETSFEILVLEILGAKKTSDPAPLQ